VVTARVERRLAAVLAADVAGYSRLMGADEVGTLEALKAIRREIVDPAIAEHKGRIVKTTGDGLLVEFASAVDAVTCAMAVQEKVAGREGQIAFRIGINIGDIISDENDIFGDGVNVAARVENECAPGGVCLSGSAFEQVRGKTKFEFDDLGERSLKNIDRMVRLYGVKLGNAPKATIADSNRPLPLPDKPSIAVLPFQNMSGDPEQEYFADGMVEDIITALSRFKWLFVIARNSTFTYKGRSVDIRQVGRELGVRYVLEGSVRRASDRVRITAQLIDAETRAHIWADRYDRAVDDIFALQDEITLSTVAAIEPSLRQAEIERAKRKRPENLDAYDLVLRATPLVDTGMPEGASQQCHSLSAHFYLSRTTRSRTARRRFAMKYYISEREGVKTIAQLRYSTRILQWRLAPTMPRHLSTPQSLSVLSNITVSWLRKRSRPPLQSPHRQRGHIPGAR
jgi:adenylate cyclase